MSRVKICNKCQDYPYKKHKLFLPNAKLSTVHFKAAYTYICLYIYICSYKYKLSHQSWSSKSQSLTTSTKLLSKMSVCGGKNNRSLCRLHKRLDCRPKSSIIIEHGINLMTKILINYVDITSDIKIKITRCLSQSLLA